MNQQHPQTERNTWLTVPTLVTLLCVVIMFALGYWQVQRAIEKQQRLEQISQKQAGNSLTFTQLQNEKQDPRDLPFQASGKLDTKHVFLLDNKIHQGRVGYQVVAPLMTNNGLLLVNFGWIPLGPDRQTLPQFSLPQEMVSLQGMAAIPEPNPMVRETVEQASSWPLRLQQMDMAIMSDFLQQPVSEVVMLLDTDSPYGFDRDWQPVVMPPEKHIAYAVQWFAMGVAALLVYFFAVRSRKTKQHEQSE